MQASILGRTLMVAGWVLVALITLFVLAIAWGRIIDQSAPNGRKRKRGKLMVVVGAQYGSEGKGAVVGHLTETEQAPLMVVRVGGPNAGHTVYDRQGRPWKLRQIPVGVIRPDARLVIGAGSEVDLQVLESEITALEEGGFNVRDRLWVDWSATVLEWSHVQQGHAERRRGSTGKGVGVARAERIRRRAQTMADVIPPPPGYTVWPTHGIVTEHLRAGGSVIVEGTQGYGLGLHTEFYPYTTSGDCTALDMLAQAQIPPWAVPEPLEVWLVARTFPIRVANFEGSSGALAEEVSWEQLATESGGYIRPERTTVTNNIRRVGRWDAGLVENAVAANGGAPVVRLALTMADYWEPAIAARTELDDTVPMAALMQRIVSEVESKVGAQVQLVGTGPQTMIDLRGRRHG